MLGTKQCKPNNIHYFNIKNEQIQLTKLIKSYTFTPSSSIEDGTNKIGRISEETSSINDNQIITQSK